MALSIGIGGDDGIGIDIGGGNGGGLGVDIGIGGDDGIGVGVGVGGGNGVDVDASVGGQSGVGASVGVGGGSGISADVGVGNAVDVGVQVGGNTPGTNPSNPSNPSNPGTNPSNSGGVSVATMPGRAEVAKAKRLVCRNDGNSEVYADYLVFDRTGMPVGVVASAWVGPDLKIDTLRFATLESFASPAKCLTVKAAGAQIGQGAIGLPHAGNDLQKAIARR